ncbi:hypothetical protein JD844_002369 [Phrynosoma platyrhinos]|uniref:C-type lectin domain-containing protein n=1 Tax=Phrynosoma platyrhinos TaxID=52577 RepID=A0ABQ7TBY7_PHRPL|nr:hypothetical protein JD844_002369 [Phrynosoma platyrhinos]
MCMDYGSTLVTITNRFEQAYVSSLIYGWEDEYFWTALQDINETGSFHWLSGDEVTYTHWNRNQPGYNKGGCVALATGSAMGLWEVKNCTTFKAKYICRQNLGTPVNPELPSPYPTPSLTGTCPAGWSTSPKLRHCYKVFNYDKLQEKKSWIMAQLYCQDIKAQLLSLSSYEEEHFVANTLNKIFGESEPEIHEQHWFWIGLNRRDPGAERNWRWSDGMGFSYHNFDRSNHDDDDIRNCVALDLASLQWVPLQCEAQLDWICKLPKGTDVKEPETNIQGSNEWMKYQDAEYKFFDHHSTWVQAQRICTWFQADLVSVHNQAELDFLGQNLKKFSRGQEQHWWIGLNTYENDGRFRWSDDSLLNFISWAPEDWGDQKCFTALPYICKRSNKTTVEPTLPPMPMPMPGSCTQGWHTLSNKCFKIYSQEQVTWPEAKHKCEIQGGMLATISNHLEQASITTLLPNVTFDLWIGFHDARKEFQWVESEPVKYVNWAPGEPSGYKTSTASDNPTNCAVMWHGFPSLFTGRWDDRNCLEEKHAFICQRSKDPTLSPPPATFSPAPNATLSYFNSTYRILKKPLKWQDSVLLCESLNASLVSVMEPYTQAFLTQAISSVRAPLWIGLSNEEGRRSYVWFTDESLSYTNWKDGEPQQIMGCTYMDVDGTWRTASCDAKLQGAICKMNTGPLSSHKWSYNGSCPKSVEDSSWIAFRNHCYAFHMEVMLGQKEAMKRCQKVGGSVLSILDEMENVFIWEHLQAYETQSKGAWLGMAFNPKAFLENTKAIAVVILSSLALCALIAIAIYLYKRRWSSERGTFESARYSRTNSNPSESAEKNILVSDMEMNEQQD